MARKHSSDWFRSATLKEVQKHHALSFVYDDDTTQEIMIQSFLNPDPEVFKFCIEHYSEATRQKHTDHHNWSYTAKQVSQEHRAHFVALFKQMKMKNQKDILYSSIECKDHELTVLFMEVPSLYSSPPHLLRHAVVHKNTKTATFLMKKYPESIVEAETMILHPSYAKIHPYWQKIYAAHQNSVLMAEIQTSKKVSAQKARKI